MFFAADLVFWHYSIAAVGAGQVAGWLLISASLPRLLAALTAVLLTIQPAGSVLLGIALLGEAPSAFQLAGVVMIVGAVAIATVGRRTVAPA